MIAAWMVYVLATSLLLLGAAAAAEPALRRLGRPGRGPWVAAACASVALAVLPWLPSPLPEGGPAAGAAPGAGVVELPGIDLSRAPLLRRLDAPLVALWGAGSLATLAALAGGAAALARRRRRWRPEELDGRSVLVADDDFGPAVVGVLRPRVVVPRWVSGLEPDARRMVLLHEEEHRRAGDVPLLVAVAGLAALLPWNLPLWIQLRRLRAAVELDCDRRVLRGGAEPLPYAHLLLRVGGKGAGMLSPALAEPARTLERRIEMIVETKSRLGRIGALALAGVAVLLVGLACETPAPSDVEATLESRVDAPDAPRKQSAGEVLADFEGLVFLDGEEVTPEAIAALDRESIRRIEVNKPPSSVERYGERGREGVIHIFTRDDGVPDGPTATLDKVRSEPTFTPFTVAPDILNRSEVIAAYEEEYPPLLRDAGIGGSARVHFLIDTRGEVVDVRLDESSGHEALDLAALRVAEVYRFSPALNGDEPAPVWISLPVVFQPEER